MDSAHRKIELQAPEDFAYLVDNVRRAAAASVSAAFPPLAPTTDADAATDKGRKRKQGKSAARPPPPAADGDDLHARVEALVNEYIRRAFALAAPNLTINGLPVDPDPFWYDAHHGADATANAADALPPEEPFDPRKRQRVEALARDEEDLLRDIALLKRRVPAAAVRARAQALEAALAGDDAAAAEAEAVAAATAVRAEAEEAAADADDVGDADTNADTGTGADTAHIKMKTADIADTKASAAAFAQAVAGLGRLKQEMPATVARMERARVAGDYAAAER